MTDNGINGPSLQKNVRIENDEIQWFNFLDGFGKGMIALGSGRETRHA
jgi:hypothetical protein